MGLGESTAGPPETGLWRACSMACRPGDAASSAITMDDMQQVRRLDITQRHEQTLAILLPHRDHLMLQNTIWDHRRTPEIIQYGTLCIMYHTYFLYNTVFCFVEPWVYGFSLAT